jgi:tetratricopeptide (TPR) repeat protein
MRSAIVLLAVLPMAVVAQTPADVTRWADSARIAIEVATSAGDLNGLTSARRFVERALVAKPDDGWLLHYQGYALFREATLRENRDRQDVKELWERADSILERSSMILKLPETHALRSSVMGQLIGSNPLKGMTLGPRSGAQMDEAVGLAPRNPRVHLMRGIGAIYTPSMFGGGLDKAEEHLRKAIALFPLDAPRPPAPAWGHAEAYAWLGQVLAKQDKMVDARAAYRKAVELDPDFEWVKTTLVPALDRKK